MLRFLLFISIFEVVNSSCPPGFDLVCDGECRGNYTSILSYWDTMTNDAKTRCNEIHALPMIIHNEEHLTYWRGRVSGAYAVLGLMCNPNSKLWEWTDGSSLDFKPEPGSYPADLNNACKTGGGWGLHPNGNWYFSVDHHLEHFDIFCTTELEHPSLSEDGCRTFDEDVEDGVCYQVGGVAENWHDAQMICRQLGANLASIHNAQENSFVRRLAVSQGAVNGIFLGATISGKGVNYGWIDGTEWDYSNFFPGFPKSDFGDCVAMDTTTTSGQWMNIDCTAKLPVACVRQRGAAVQSNPNCSTETYKEGIIITSPGFPFAASTPCDFFLEVDSGKRVEVVINFLEANSCCDHLIIYDGYLGGKVMANLTGEVSDVSYTTTTSNIMRVTWEPNGGVNVMGVAMTFSGI